MLRFRTPKQTVTFLHFKTADEILSELAIYKQIYNVVDTVLSALTNVLKNI